MDSVVGSSMESATGSSMQSAKGKGRRRHAACGGMQMRTVDEPLEEKPWEMQHCEAALEVKPLHMPMDQVVKGDGEEQHEALLAIGAAVHAAASLGEGSDRAELLAELAAFELEMDSELDGMRGKKVAKYRATKLRQLAFWRAALE